MMPLHRLLTLAFYSAPLFLLALGNDMQGCQTDVDDVFREVQDNLATYFQLAKDFRFIPKKYLSLIVHEVHTSEAKPGVELRATVSSTINLDPDGKSVAFTAEHPEKKWATGEGKIICLREKCKTALKKLKNHMVAGSVRCLEKGFYIVGDPNTAIFVELPWKKSYTVFQPYQVLRNLMPPQVPVEHLWTKGTAKIENMIEYISDDGKHVFGHLPQPVSPGDLEYYEAALDSVIRTSPRPVGKPTGVAEVGPTPARAPAPAPAQPLPAPAVGKGKKRRLSFGGLGDTLKRGRKSASLEDLRFSASSAPDGLALSRVWILLTGTKEVKHIGRENYNGSKGDRAAADVIEGNKELRGVNRHSILYQLFR